MNDHPTLSALLDVDKSVITILHMKLKETTLQQIEFGDEPEDHYYCLIDTNVSPDGLQIDQMRLTDPRNIDEEFRKQGCLMMLTGDEIGELIDRGELDPENLHESLFRLSVKEGVLKEDDEE